ncbi:MAG: hypothetical protein BGO98_01105 [Myxococcales bacterium 68-20]|mgnify:FL=1|nr:MAG: hypothetical protein BGO98_01105 [Myxococcales bacterium 68-20]
MSGTNLRNMGAGGALLLVAGSSAAVLLLIACANDGMDASEPAAPRDDGGAGVIEDASRPNDDLDGAADPDAGIAVDSGEAGVDPCTVDWCKTPLPIPDGGKLSLMDVWVPAPNDAWAVSEQGLVLRWNGTLWSVVWDAGKPLYGVWGDHEGALWAVGGQGAIFHAPNGTGWAEIPSGVTTDLLGICEGARDAERPRNVAIVGSSGTVLRWSGETGEDGHPSWTTSSPGAMLDLHHVWCAGFDIWVSGQSTDWLSYGGALFLDKGDGWERQTVGAGTENYASGNTFSSVWAYDRQNVWLRGGRGFVHGTASLTDPALKWSEQRVTMSGGLKRISDIWGSGPNDVWFAGTFGRIHHWDGSELAITATTNSWDVLASHLHAVSGSGPDDVWVVGENVALHRNVDKGAQK